MPPPELPTDTPGANVVHEVVVRLLPDFGDDLCAPRFHGVNRLVCQRLAVHPPLQHGKGFNDHAASLRATRCKASWFDLRKETEFFEVFDDLFPRFVAVHAHEFRRTGIHHRCFEADDLNALKVVSNTTLKVVGIVSRRDLHGPGSLGGVGQNGVCNNRDFPAHDRQENHLSDQMLVALVIGVYRHCGIAEHGFRPRRSHHNVAAAVREWVSKIPEASVFFFAVDLEI